MQQIDTQKITLSNSETFSYASGDFNPIHIDEVYARKTQFGFCICHGVNILLTLLDSLNRSNLIKGIPNFDCKFQRPIFLDNDFDIYWEKTSKIAHVICNNEVSVLVQFDELEQISMPESEIDIIRLPLASTPNYVSSESTLHDLVKITEQTHINFRGEFAAIEGLFPNLIKTASRNELMEILSTSDLVGMKIPGRDSLFVGLRKLSKRLEPTISTIVLDNYDPRFGLLNMSVEGEYSAYKIEAMFRASPTPTPNLSEIRKQVKINEFINHRVLVIGGSRGLGRFAVAVLAMGGADVHFTFNQGLTEAQSLQKELKNFKISCCYQQYNVLQDPIPNINNFDRIFYFASPKIIPETDQNISGLSKFYDAFFVTKFNAICSSLNIKDRRQKVFYPSTIFIDQPDNAFKAYASSKKAGELVADKFNVNSTKVFAPRLPRLKTDQTLSINQFLLSELNFLLPYIRSFMDE
jgi:hypothetical protein